MGRRCIHSTPHNHNHARYTAGSLSVLPGAREGGSVLYPSFVPVRTCATGSPFIYFTQSDWGLRVSSRISRAYIRLQQALV